MTQNIPARLLPIAVKHIINLISDDKISNHRGSDPIVIQKNDPASELMTWSMALCEQDVSHASSAYIDEDLTHIVRSISDEIIHANALLESGFLQWHEFSTPDNYRCQKLQHLDKDYLNLIGEIRSQLASMRIVSAVITDGCVSNNPYSLTISVGELKTDGITRNNHSSDHWLVDNRSIDLILREQVDAGIVPVPIGMPQYIAPNIPGLALVSGILGSVFIVMYSGNYDKYADKECKDPSMSEVDLMQNVSAKKMYKIFAGSRPSNRYLSTEHAEKLNYTMSNDIQSTCDDKRGRMPRAQISSRKMLDLFSGKRDRSYNKSVKNLSSVWIEKDFQIKK